MKHISRNRRELRKKAQTKENLVGNNECCSKILGDTTSIKQEPDEMQKGSRRLKITAKYKFIRRVRRKSHILQNVEQEVRHTETVSGI